MATESFATEAGHWYDRTGAARYTVVGKNGKERATTLRDARELDLLPSVTSILKLEAAPGLERWKIEQALLSAMTLPRIEGESADDFMKRALQDSKEQARKAAEKGTELHGALEAYMKSGRILPGADWDIIGPCVTWLSTNFAGYKWHPERSFASQHGFGGKLDLYGESFQDVVVIDYKFKADIVEGKRLAYDNHSTQLAAYAYGVKDLDLRVPRCLNLFISSTVPGLIVPVEHPPEDIATGWEVFKHLLAIWKLRRGL